MGPIPVDERKYLGVIVYRPEFCRPAFQQLKAPALRAHPSRNHSSYLARKD